jgi:predicted nucleic acid-binding protein
MIIIVDTNILFSACLTPSGRIFEILFNAPPYVQLISSHLAIEELKWHKQKLLKLSKHSEEDLDLLIELVLKQIEFFDYDIIENKHWQEADRLTNGVDGDDISFVALALQTGGILWTGDKNCQLT